MIKKKENQTLVIISQDKTKLFQYL